MNAVANKEYTRARIIRVLKEQTQDNMIVLWYEATASAIYDELALIEEEK